MNVKCHSPEQIIRKLRTAEQLLNQGRSSLTSPEPWRTPQLLMIVGVCHFA